ncbi:MAG: MoaD/ThiS family protein [Leptospirales bacterium]|nr:MoaD/ThiS family protein [Leptospirales bacterium]
MKVNVKLFATLREKRFIEKEFEVDEGTVVEDLFKLFDLRSEEVTIIFINGRHGDFNSPLKDGDSIGLFPPVGGG